MDIHISKLLAKMEKEVRMAMNGSSESEVRERLLAVKTLCDLVLDERSGESSEPFKPKLQASKPLEMDALQLQKMMGASSFNKKKEDEDSGDSLFDF
ncbi:YwdI family protein [Metabacillus indicus]|uniref:YwdI family protein n=1 Tax=Metabacillus indicus TaxID=246786 RepID=UPI002493B94E|nr:YwdI family protein [Metabacillus indicus]